MSARHPTRPEDTRQGIAAAWERARIVLADEVLRIAAGLSLVLILFHGYPRAQSRLFEPTVAFIVLPLVFFPKLLTSALFWGWITLAATFALFEHWYMTDNHKILLFYWLFSLTLCFLLNAQEQERFLTAAARFLLVFVFAGAVVQKTIDASYMSGEFFEFTLLFDQRFELFLKVFGVAVDRIAEIRSAVEGFMTEPDLAGQMVPFEVASDSRIARLATLVTWWDLLVQVWIAVLFALRRRWADIAGHAGLLAFVFTTYIFAPVIGFGWTLCIWAYVISARTFPGLALVYIVMLQVLTIYDLPWNAVLTRLGF